MVECYEIKSPATVGGVSLARSTTPIITPVARNIKSETPTRSSRLVRTENIEYVHHFTFGQPLVLTRHRSATLSHASKASSDSAAMSNLSSAFLEKRMESGINPGGSDDVAATILVAQMVMEEAVIAVPHAGLKVEEDHGNSLHPELPTFSEKDEVINVDATTVTPQVGIPEVVTGDEQDATQQICLDDIIIAATVDDTGVEAEKTIPTRPVLPVLESEEEVHIDEEVATLKEECLTGVEAEMVVPTSPDEEVHIHEEISISKAESTENHLEPFVEKIKPAQVSDSSDATIKTTVRDTTVQHPEATQCVDRTAELVKKVPEEMDVQIIEHASHPEIAARVVEQKNVGGQNSIIQGDVDNNNRNITPTESIGSISPPSQRSAESIIDFCTRGSYLAGSKYTKQSHLKSPFQRGATREQKRANNPWWTEGIISDAIIDQDREQRQAAMPKLDPSTIVYTDIYKPVKITEDGNRIRIGSAQDRIIQHMDTDSSSLGSQNVAGILAPLSQNIQTSKIGLGMDTKPSGISSSARIGKSAAAPQLLRFGSILTNIF